jgi:hypothetical protein
MTRIALVVTLVALMASPALAQRRGRDRDRGGEPRFNKGEIERIIKRLERNTDAFKKAVDRQLDHSALNGSRREDRINDRVSDLEKATDRLKDRFDRSDSFGETRSDVENVVREAGNINDLFDRVREYSRVRSSWSAVRSDINALAGVYRVRSIR